MAEGVRYKRMDAQFDLSKIDPSQVKVISQPPPSDQGGVMDLTQVDPSQVRYLASSPQEANYGGLGQQAISGLEGAARGASLGTSDYLEQKLGVPQQDILGRMQANPWTSGLGSLVGGAGLIGATGGLAAPIEGALGSGLLGTAAGFGAEGAAFGAGNAVSEASLGDPNMNASKILAHIGFGAATGAGLGALSKSLGLAKALIKPAEEAAPAIGEAAPAAVADFPQANSLDAMQKAVEDHRNFGGGEDVLELPEKQVASDAAGRINDQLGSFGVTDPQLESLSSQEKRNDWKAMAQLPGANGEKIRNFEGAQKKAAINAIDKNIDKIAPGYTPTTDAAEAGERAADAFTNVIETNRKELGPAFEQIKSTPLNDTDHLPGVLDYLTKANPKIANMFETGGDSVAIKPYKSSMGIDKATYTALHGAIDSLQDNPTDFESLFDIRKGLSQHVDVTKLGDAAKEITQAKAAMMDYIQDAVQSQDPDLAVRDTFKKYAINEQNAQFIEKKFGAEIGDGNFRSLAKGKPEERILSKIFSDSAAVDAAKQILPPEEFNKLLADHLAIMRNEATSDGVFSSKKFSSAMRKNQYALDAAIGDNPALQNIKDAATIARIFPDSIPANPSGTAPTLLKAIGNILKDPKNVLFPHNFIYEAAGLAKGKISEALQARAINQKLAGVSSSTNNLSAIQGIVEKVSDSIASKAKGILTNDTLRGGALAGANRLMSQGEYDKLSERLGQFSANPKTMMDHVADNTQEINQAAPNLNQSLTNTMFKGVAFLNSKLPQQAVHLPLGPKWEPSKAQMMQFSEYYHAVNNPISAMKAVKDGSLTNQTMEALQAVHPELLQEMQSKLLENINLEKAKGLPYARKLALSKFLNTPLDENMTGAAITNNQMAMNAPSQSQRTPEAQAAKGPRSTLGGLKQLNFASRTQNGSQDDS